MLYFRGYVPTIGEYITRDNIIFILFNPLFNARKKNSYRYCKVNFDFPCEENIPNKLKNIFKPWNYTTLETRLKEPKTIKVWSHSETVYWLNANNVLKRGVVDLVDQKAIELSDAIRKSYLKNI